MYRARICRDFVPISPHELIVSGQLLGVCHASGASKVSAQSEFE